MSVEVTESPQNSYFWELGRTGINHTLKLKHHQQRNKPPQHILQLSARDFRNIARETLGTPGSNPRAASYNKGEFYNKERRVECVQLN